MTRESGGLQAPFLQKACAVTISGRTSSCNCQSSRQHVLGHFFVAEAPRCPTRAMRVKSGTQCATADLAR